jgi:hypothetical protein
MRKEHDSGKAGDDEEVEEYVREDDVCDWHGHRLAVAHAKTL